MKVEVICRETIKPSTPTPHHLRNLPFSSLDQHSSSDYVTILLFYSSNDHTKLKHIKFFDQLKTSLSKTLTYFYPVAGRIKDGISVDCSDEGVDFYEARANVHLSEFLEQVNIDELDQFLPCGRSATEADLSKKPLLAIQANIFDCGGVALAICISHKIGDGVSLGTLINTWAGVARGASASHDIPCMHFDLSSHFPMKDSSNIIPNSSAMHPNIVTRRFVFDASRIAALRDFARNKKNSSVENPTRVELVSALIWWRAMVVARRENKTSRAYAVIHAVNLRQRMIPPLSDRTFGNAARPTITPFLTGEMEAEYTDLVGHVRDSIRKVDEKYVMELQSGSEGFMNCFKEARKQFDGCKLVHFDFNSWCRFPFYEADFGWGTPTWVATTKLAFRDAVILIDTRSGDGIEAWVNMLEEDMSQLEHDPEFFSFISTK